MERENNYKNKRRDKWVTLVGWLRKVDTNIKTSKTGNEYYSMSLEVSEVKENAFPNRNEENKDEESKISSTAFLVFWKNNFDEKMIETILSFKEGQALTVSGFLASSKREQFNNSLLNVRSIETETEIFI